MPLPKTMPAEPNTMATDALLRHAGLVRSLARALLSDEAAVDDVVQDTWVAALQHPPRKRESLGSWLGTVARRLALRKLRGEERRGRREAVAAKPETVASDGGEREQLLEGVTRAVLALDEVHRQTVLLRFYEGLGPTEIAQRTGVPVATVASRLQRALRRIRAQLDRETQGGRKAWSAAVIATFGGPAVPIAPIPQGAPGAPIAKGAPRAPHASGPNGASSASALETAAGVSTLTQGALIMGTKSKLAVAGLAAGCGALALWGWIGDGTPTGPREVAQVPAEDVELSAPATVAAPAEPEREQRSEVVTPPAEIEVAAVAPTTGALAFRAMWSSGEAAAERSFEFFPWDGMEPFMERRTLTTDARGEIFVDELPPGDVMVYGDLGGGGRVTIEAGATTEFETTIPDGIQLEGRVITVTESGEERSVAGARIWLSDYGNDDEGTIVALSGVDGSFSIRSVGVSRHIAAYADGFSPTLPRAVTGNVGEVREMVLLLEQAGRSVAGVVVDGEDRPAAGARVRAASVHRRMYQGPDGQWVKPFAPLEVRSDEAGRFELVGLPTTGLRISARSPGHAPETRELEASSDRDTWIDLRLLPACIVRGTVTDAEGEPVAGAEIHHGRYAEFLSSFARSRTDGTFQFSHLPAGDVELSAEHADHGRAEVRLQLASGEPAEWNPVLDSGRPLFGRVVDTEGAGRAGYTVAAIGTEPVSDSGGLWSAQVETEDDGSFRVASCPDDSVWIEVRTAEYIVVAALRDVRPDGEELVIEVSDDVLPSAHLRGEVIDARGDGVAAQITLWGPDKTGGYAVDQADAETGEFALGPLPPGEYTMALTPDALPPLDARKIELERGQTLDLGSWILPDPVPVAFEVEGQAGLAPFDSITVFPLLEPGVWGRPREFDAASYAEASVWPGSYVARADGASVCAVTAPFEAAEGETAHVAFEVHEGVERTFVLQPGAAPLPTMVSCSIRDANQESAASWRNIRPAPEDLTHRCRLRPGDYELIVRSPDEDLAIVPFHVDAKVASTTVYVPLP